MDIHPNALFLPTVLLFSASLPAQHQPAAPHLSLPLFLTPNLTLRTHSLNGWFSNVDFSFIKSLKNKILFFKT